MSRRLKVLKRIKGVKVPKPARKVAKRLLRRVQGEQLEMLAGAVVAALIAHVADREGKEKLSGRLGRAVGSHFAR